LYVLVLALALGGTCGGALAAQTPYQTWSDNLLKAEKLSEAQEQRLTNSLAVNERLRTLSQNQSDTIGSLRTEIQRLQRLSQDRLTSYQRLSADHEALQKSFEQSEKALNDTRRQLQKQGRRNVWRIVLGVLAGGATGYIVGEVMR